MKDRRVCPAVSSSEPITGIEISKIYLALKPRLRLVLLICLVAVFLLSVCMLVLDYAQGAKEEDAFKELANMVKDNTPPSATAQNVTAQTPLSKQGSPDVLVQYRTLWKQNPDMAGWISIDGTSIDYPVMYTPANVEFYINHGFDKEKTKSGVPFIDERCDVNPLGVNTIIYGHHMKNGTMFADLENYKDKSFYTKHPTIRFDTLNTQQEYQVIAAFESRIYQKNDKAFKFYNYAEIKDDADFNEYIENIKALSIYDTGVAVSSGDTLLTLVTCAYQTENGRFVVVAKKSA